MRKRAWIFAGDVRSPKGCAHAFSCSSEVHHQYPESMLKHSSHVCAPTPTPLHQATVPQTKEDENHEEKAQEVTEEDGKSLTFLWLPVARAHWAAKKMPRSWDPPLWLNKLSASGKVALLAMSALLQRQRCHAAALANLTVGPKMKITGAVAPASAPADKQERSVEEAAEERGTRRTKKDDNCHKNGRKRRGRRNKHMKKHNSKHKKRMKENNKRTLIKNKGKGEQKKEQEETKDKEEETRR